MKDYYKILEIETTASIDQVKSQWKLLLHAWHPDKFPNEELKGKANNKIIEINEAYNILSDPMSRAIYDKALKSESQFTKQTPHSKSSPATTNQYCISCGQPADTRYVDFRENIGMLIMRKYRSIKGNFCSYCINYYFWNLTGKTMLFGWWGMISFIVTPFILLNNLMRYVISLGNTKPIYQIAPTPSPLLIISTIGGYLFISIIFISFICSTSTAMLIPSIPVSTSTAYFMPTKVKTPTQKAINCNHWASITSENIGEYRCVYGVVYKTKFIGKSTFQVLFSDYPNALFLAAGSGYYSVSPGECVAAEGQILRATGGVPYIDIDEALYDCESWMK